MINEFTVTKNDETGEEFTSFMLVAGTKLQLGSETVELAVDSDIFFIRKTLSRDGLAETFVGAGVDPENLKRLSTVEERDGVSYRITYGGRGQRIETPLVYTEEEAAAQAEGEKPKRKAKTDK